MSQMNHVVRSVSLFTKGDLTVGINGENAVISAEGDFLLDLNEMDEVDRPIVIERFRQKLTEAFSEIWDEPIHVRFDFEDTPD